MDDPRDVLTAAFSALSDSGEDTAGLEARLRELDVAQIVGPNPRNRPTRSQIIATKALVSATLVALRNNQIEGPITLGLNALLLQLAGAERSIVGPSPKK